MIDEPAVDIKGLLFYSGDDFRTGCITMRIRIHRPFLPVLAAVLWAESVFGQAPAEKAARALLAENCLGCHGELRMSGLDLRQRETMLKGGQRGPAIVPGKPVESLLLKAVERTGDLKMPPGKQTLSVEQIGVLRSWINQGARWENDNKDGGAGAPSWWSFRKPVRPAVPVTSGNRPKNPIDAFIEAKLREKGLTAAPPADPRTLIRRVYFDLTGLPPAIDEVEAFEKDPSQAAYEKLVDRLLESPRYGERYGKHWLDVVRYADSGGYETDLYLRNAWRYRDYVIQSFHLDKPFDQFVQEQIAGDEIWPDDLALEGSYDIPDEKRKHLTAWIGTGMYAVGAEVGESNLDFKKARAEKLADWADITGAAFLGLTFGCARCHDHKFDPVTQKDYYRLQAIFGGSREIEIPVTDKMQLRARDIVFSTQMLPILELRTAYKLLVSDVTKRSAAAVKARFPPHVVAAYEKDARKRTAQEKAITAPLVDAIQSIQVEKEMTPDELRRHDDLLRQIAKGIVNLPTQTGDRPIPFDGLLDVATATVLGHFERALVRDVHVLDRGELDRPRDKVLPGLPAALSQGRALTPDCSGNCVPYYRKQLALWLTESDHPLTSRVIVNRVWFWHFGQGLVSTLNDFGRQGQVPTHPELLDWLATDFVAGGWRMKRLHRMILLSDAYQRSSRFANDANAAKDAGNRSLWRMNRRRLEAEAIWDAVHAVAGTLSLRMGGRPVVPPLSAEERTGLRSRNQWVHAGDPEDQNRRGVYVLVRRNSRFPLFDIFDGADPSVSCPERDVTTVAPQALWLMNNSVPFQQAQHLARRVAHEVGTNPAARVEQAWRFALQRMPSPEEKRQALELLASLEGLDGSASQPALEKLCLAIFNLSEFIFVD
ncbi:MAG: DUF1553 domain-containing protein [Acidobacteria bacterium]|nr:DUF1553 domain-containing protein [Acidobacteriota bacterium]